jgi:hypothetical protein
MKLYIFIFCALFTTGLFAQDTFTPVSKGGFNPESGVKTTTITIEGKTFDVFSTKSGANYVKGNANNSSIYAIWVGESTGQTVIYNNKKYDLRVAKSGSYFILTLTKTGWPKPIYGIKK